MISVASADSGSAHVQEFRRWVEAEWGKVDPFAVESGTALPSPILAVDDGELVGGLSFTYFTVPGTEEEALWINTLLVAPQSRGIGIGSKLVLAAETVVATTGVVELFVYTDIPDLYLKLGWEVSHDAGENIVLKKKLNT